MLAEVGELLELDQELLDDLKTTVSEACNNVVMHAYPSGEGPLEILLAVLPAGLEVRVRDEGRGVEPEAGASEGEEGLGLAVIRALVHELEISRRAGAGTEVRMLLSGERDGKRLFRNPGEAQPSDDFAPSLEGDAVVSVSPASLVGGLMGRLARALAANVGFSLDRFSDIYLVTDALAAHVAKAASSDRVAFAVSAEELRLELIVGPFRGGSGERLSSKGMRGPFPLALLSDELSVEPVGDGDELVRAVLIDSHRESDAAADAPGLEEEAR